MRRNPMATKLLSVGIIFLFILIAVASGITAAPTQKDTVRFTVELCGSDTNYTVDLTAQQAHDLYKVFDDVKHQLTTIKTREQTQPIFTKALQRLSAIGVLNGPTLTQAEDLVLPHHDTQPLKNTSHTDLALAGNSLCSIAGNVSNTYFSRVPAQILNTAISAPFIVAHTINTKIIQKIPNLAKTILEKILTIPLEIITYLLYALGELLYTLVGHIPYFVFAFLLFLLQLPTAVFLENVLATLLSVVGGALDALHASAEKIVLLLIEIVGLVEVFSDIPWLLMNYYTNNFSNQPMHGGRITFGNDRWGPSSGWVTTVGANGNVQWNGTFYGQLPLVPYLLTVMTYTINRYYFYPGVMDYNGIRIWSNENQNWYILGNALWVNLGPDLPNNPWRLD